MVALWEGLKLKVRRELQKSFKVSKSIVQIALKATLSIVQVQNKESASVVVSAVFKQDVAFA